MYDTALECCADLENTLFGTHPAAAAMANASVRFAIQFRTLAQPLSSAAWLFVNVNGILVMRETCASLSHFLSHSLSLSFSFSFSLSFRLPRMPSLAFPSSHSPALSFCLSFYLLLSFSLVLIHTRTHSHAHPPIHSHTHTISLSHTYTHVFLFVPFVNTYLLLEYFAARCHKHSDVYTMDT